MSNRRRPIAKQVYFSEDEWSQVEEKMGQAGVINFSAFAAGMLLRGQVKTYDFSHLKELNAYMGRIAGNINQIAKRCNENQSVHTNDVEQLRREFMALKADYQQRAVKLLRKL